MTQLSRPTERPRAKLTREQAERIRASGLLDAVEDWGRCSGTEQVPLPPR